MVLRDLYADREKHSDLSHREFSDCPSDAEERLDMRPLKEGTVQGSMGSCPHYKTAMVTLNNVQDDIGRGG